MLIETCKLPGVEPRAYLADVLTRIVKDHRNSQIDDLLPWAYIQALELKAVACGQALNSSRMQHRAFL